MDDQFAAIFGAMLGGPTGGFLGQAVGRSTLLDAQQRNLDAPGFGDLANTRAEMMRQMAGPILFSGMPNAYPDSRPWIDFTCRYCDLTAHVRLESAGAGYRWPRCCADTHMQITGRSE